MTNRTVDTETLLIELSARDAGYLMGNLSVHLGAGRCSAEVYERFCAAVEEAKAIAAD